MPETDTLRSAMEMFDAGESDGVGMSYEQEKERSETYRRERTIMYSERSQDVDRATDLILAGAAERVALIIRDLNRNSMDEPSLFMYIIEFGIKVGDLIDSVQSMERRELVIRPFGELVIDPDIPFYVQREFDVSVESIAFNTSPEQPAADGCRLNPKIIRAREDLGDTWAFFRWVEGTAVSDNWEEEYSEAWADIKDWIAGLYVATLALCGEESEE